MYCDVLWCIVSVLFCHFTVTITHSHCCSMLLRRRHSVSCHHKGFPWHKVIRESPAGEANTAEHCGYTMTVASWCTKCRICIGCVGLSRCLAACWGTWYHPTICKWCPGSPWSLRQSDSKPTRDQMLIFDSSVPIEFKVAFLCPSVHSNKSTKAHSHCS